MAFVASIAAAAVGLAVALVLLDYRPGDVALVGVLALVAALSERGSVRISDRSSESISLLPTLFAAVLFGPLAAMAVGAASMLAKFRRPYMGWAVYTSSRAINGGLTGLVAIQASSLVNGRVAAIALAASLAAVVGESLDVAFGAVTMAIRGAAKWREVVAMLMPLVLASVPLYVPVVTLLAVAYVELSPWTLPLFFAPALAAQRLFVLYEQQRRLAEKLVSANRQLERANISFATALVATLDARDRYTAGHSSAVAVYARDIAARMGLPEEEQQLAHLCGLVHDIGKIGLPAGLLEKGGPLTLEEHRRMQEHVEIGERILRKVEDYAEVATIIRHHHERVDGNGYPDGLVGEEIPLLSRIIAVADAYNAMTSDRPYRDALPSRVARLRLARAVETQFDTSAVAAFEAILASATGTYRSGSRADFSLEAQDRYSREPAAEVA